MVSDEKLQQAAEMLDGARLVSVLSGAGISKESGIPTFREAQTGLWARFDPEQLATPQAFRRDPGLVWSWYMYRLSLVSEVAPNPGHRAVAELESLVPQVVVLTQNVDGLHTEAGSTDVVELHGSIRRHRCMANCQGSPTLVDIDTVPHDAEDVPRCPHCGNYLRPDVVWFGEMLPEGAIERAFDVAERSDVMLVVGTSGVVQPAASLPLVALQAGAGIIEVNPAPSEITPLAHVYLQGPAGQVLPALVDALRARRG
ncbi:MAG TPA: NAD-dependent deacylase [Aggregatilineales bacterium]|nr:NAD-dependent deacylase [Chloroflexota bacterium]HOA23917.1 NAD-dependent deacylase [Aggregatilineales bacterium]HQA67866.1 NAD-dependent deacylase [Aggregatilineales bacterium]HQE19080.1 NAD-dependent deacylase [Aggregatilineales bacterium]